VQRLRQELEQLRQQKRVSFHDLDRLIRKIVRQYDQLFPNFETKNKGSRVVYHLRVEELFPISIEREHKGRDFMLPYYAKLALNQIEQILDYVEQRL
jgi:hypothetical protein